MLNNCRCGHGKGRHLDGGACTGNRDDSGDECRCRAYRPVHLLRNVPLRGAATLFGVLAVATLWYDPSRAWVADRLGLDDGQLPTPAAFVQSLDQALPGVLPPAFAGIVAPRPVVADPVQRVDPVADASQAVPTYDGEASSLAVSPREPSAPAANAPIAGSPGPQTAPPTTTKTKQHPGHPVPVRKQVGKKK